MEKVAVFIAYYGIANSPSILNLLELLSRNYLVDLYYLTYKGNKEIEKLKIKNLTVYQISKKPTIAFLKVKIKSFIKRYKHYIAMDPRGFILFRDIYPNEKGFYYSLELFMLEEQKDKNFRDYLINKERNNIKKNLKGLIIQNREREVLFKKEYNLSKDFPTLHLPVTYYGDIVKKKSDYIREKYSISKDKKIALHIGGINYYYSCIENALSFSNLEKWVLFFHGYASSEYVTIFKSFIKEKNIKNVIINDELFDDVESIMEVVKSADVGIAWYNDISANFRTAGGSSGKISAYLRCGLPVIANKYESTINSLENTGSGVCVSSHEDIVTALDQIQQNYNFYSENAYKEYDRTYNFSNYEDKIITFLNNI